MTHNLNVNIINDIKSETAKKVIEERDIKRFELPMMTFVLLY